MVNHVVGLLLSYKQMVEFGTYLAGKPLAHGDNAFGYCRKEVRKFQHRFIAIDYPKGSLKGKLMLVLWDHDSEVEFNLEKAKTSKLTMTARDWLKQRGVSDTENLKFVDTEDTWIEQGALRSHGKSTS
ncbi:hypothetical protein BJ912DRAFT_921664 [Pholiota molesta]|nr:hypothetical protein BJ912DRAFT_921664 [Pholiota molesta]